MLGHILSPIELRPVDTSRRSNQLAASLQLCIPQFEDEQVRPCLRTDTQHFLEERLAGMSGRVWAKISAIEAVDLETPA